MVNAVPSRSERQATALRVREGSEGARRSQALLDESKVADAADALGVARGRRRAIRGRSLESSVRGGRLWRRACAVRRLRRCRCSKRRWRPRARSGKRRAQAYLDSLQRQVRSTNSTSKPSINENPYTYIVEHPTLEVGAEPVQTATRFSVPAPGPLFELARAPGRWGWTVRERGGMSARRC
jgi:hypothetical protein